MRAAADRGSIARSRSVGWHDGWVLPTRERLRQASKPTCHRVPGLVGDWFRSGGTADPEFLGNHLSFHLRPRSGTTSAAFLLSHRNPSLVLVLALGLRFGDAFALALQHAFPLELGKAADVRPHL